MDDTKKLTEKESFDLIAAMIHTAKNDFHDSGASAILWGTVVAVCSFVTFAEVQWDFSIGFDIWLLTAVALIPQIWFIVKDARQRTVRTYEEDVVGAVWMVYGITIIALILYANIVPGVSDRMMSAADLEVISRNTVTGVSKPYRTILPSFTSIFLIVYAFPTIITGLVCHEKPMIYGAIACYIFFILSLFVPFKYDMLLSGLAGIGNWLIPGFILQRRYKKVKKTDVQRS